MWPMRALLALLALGSSASIAQQRVTLDVWDQHTGDAEQAIEQLDTAFEKKYPNILISRQAYTLPQLIATARLAMSSDTGPDVLYYEVSSGRDMFRAGLLANLTPYAKAFGWPQRIYPDALRWGTYDGKIFGVPLEWEFAGVFYNKTLLDRAHLKLPSTLPEVLQFCQAARQAGYIPFAHGQNPGWQNYFSYAMPLNNILGLDGMKALLFGGSGRWDSPQSKQAMAVFDRQMRDAKCFVQDVNGLDQDGSESLFNSGKALMFAMGTWEVPPIIDGVGNKYDIEMMPFPAIPPSTTRVYTGGMGSLYLVSAHSKHKREAAEYLDFLLSPDAAKTWTEVARFIPPVPLDMSSLNVTPLQRFARSVLVNGSTGRGPKLGYHIDLVVPDEFNAMMRQGFQSVMSGQKSIDQQAADLEKIWEARSK